MKGYQWFLLGMVIAWTPGLLALVFMLRRHKTDDLGQEAGTGNRHMP